MAALTDVKTIDMKNGEITKVSYEGSEYERVEGDAKVGDLVHLARVGAFYKCYDVDSEGDAVFSVGIASNRSKYDLFRKKHTRLKVGDYARVVDWPSRFKGVEGDLVKVLRDDRKHRPFHCELLNGNYVGQNIWARESELVLATEAEVAAAKEAEAKRSIEAKWAKIGREVDEYKVGDIVAYDDQCWFGNSGIGEVSEATNENENTYVVATDNRGRRSRFYLSSEKLTLITPVEARFDRS
ncbi:hypothetical protein [Bacillus altitudinis]|uniref:hypothetical protein n=1 Tax=Bacillus altitudinis TaxID=293387 RepID=UPI00228116EC|nr:hypothetical protein [Bacillus altitudinis]MCY7439397.1 hypothetical protein [Bacillus altitudinis]MEC1142435.1 hypothetical protein [Bacillus altitudinis]